MWESQEGLDRNNEEFLDIEWLIEEIEWMLKFESGMSYKMRYKQMRLSLQK